MKHNTIQRYLQWKQTANKNDLFCHGTRTYTQQEFDSIIGIKPVPKIVKAINIVEDTGYADMDATSDLRDIEKSGK